MRKQELSNILGHTLQRLRRLSKTSQTELAKNLGIHQTALCRVEGGQQNLTPFQLLKASEYFGIDSDALLQGKINYNAVAARFQEDILLPKRYKTLQTSKLRELLPFIHYLRQKNGDKVIDGILRELEMESILYMTPESTVSAHCLIDLVESAVDQNYINEQDLSEITEYARSEEINGFLHPIFTQQERSIPLIQTYFLNNHHFERNFSYDFDFNSRVKKSLKLHVTPEAHMKSTNYKSIKIGNLLCLYKKNLIQLLPKYINKKPVKIIEKHCHFKGSESCQYEIHAS